MPRCIKLRNPDSQCPCGSGQLLKYCCLPDIPPISARDYAYMSLNVESKVLDPFNRELPMGHKVSLHMINPNQEFGPIKKLLDETVIRAWQSGANKDEIDRVSLFITNLKDRLNTIRYHQKQVLYRLMLLNLEQIPLAPIKGNVSVVMIDIPLKSELEAFISGVRSCLDVLAKLVGHTLNIKQTTHGRLINHLTKSTQKGLKKNLLEIYQKNEFWFDEGKHVRDRILHDGSFIEFKGFEHEYGLISQPKIKNLNAEQYCFYQWRLLFSFVTEVLKIIYSEEPDSSK